MSRAIAAAASDAGRPFVDPRKNPQKSRFRGLAAARACPTFRLPRGNTGNPFHHRVPQDTYGEEESRSEEGRSEGRRQAGRTEADQGSPEQVRAWSRTSPKTTGVAASDVRAVMAALEGAVHGSVSKKGAGSFTLPGLLKITAVSVPAKPKRKGINPFTKEEQWFAAKPASVKVKVRPLKKLKDAAA